MNNPKRITRRGLIATGGGSIAAAVFGAHAGSAAGITPANPEGPFFPIHRQVDKDADLTRVEGRAGRAEGEIIRVTGQVVDQRGQPVAGALLDVWQANAFGRYHDERDSNPAPVDPNFQGWAKLVTDAEGRYGFTTVKPGSYPVGGHWHRPPHIHFKVARRGFHELTTQMYFAGEALNERDRLYLSVPEQERSGLTIRFDMPGTPPMGRFDIVLRQA